MAVVEIERRVILFKPTTTLPDDSQLTYDADPNSASGSGTAGEILLYNSPLGTQYIQSNGSHWRKTATPNTWTAAGTGSGIVDGTNTGDIIRWNAGTNAWESCAEPFDFTQINLTPQAAAVEDAEGGFYYKSGDKSIYVCTSDT